jgi:L-cysteine:1D-myo-inositol 2-amino-2-deoxy-alpha-D-glucopyranoside ligase
MSKSLGNLVFVSRLRAGGTDPMAIRLAILAHHYRGDWDWTADGLAAAGQRLARWRAAVSRGLAPGEPAGPAAAAGPGDGGAPSAGGVPAAGGVGVPAGEGVPSARSVLAAVRERIAADLDAAGALAAVDRWAGAMLGAPVLPPGSGAAAELVRATVDALLGIAL